LVLVVLDDIHFEAGHDLVDVVDYHNACVHHIVIVAVFLAHQLLLPLVADDDNHQNQVAGGHLAPYLCAGTLDGEGPFGVVGNFLVVLAVQVARPADLLQVRQSFLDAQRA
jgi:hypothetical protein